MARPGHVYVGDGIVCVAGWQGQLYMLVMVLFVMQDGKARSCICWWWYCLCRRMARPTVHAGDGTVCDAGWQGQLLYMLVLFVMQDGKANSCTCWYCLWCRMARPNPVHVGTVGDAGWQGQLLYMLVLFVMQDGKANSCTCWWWYCLWCRMARPIRPQWWGPSWCSSDWWTTPPQPCTCSLPGAARLASPRHKNGECLSGLLGWSQLIEQYVEIETVVHSLTSS